MKKLTIDELAPYLPYGLKVIFESKGGRTFELEGLRLNSLKSPINTESFFISSNNATYFIGDFKPILRPLSDLTKEIEVNGERFVPIEMFEIGDDGGYNFDFGNGNTQLIASLKTISEYNVTHDISYLPFQVVKELISWHFDIFNLIPEGLAIDANTL